MQVGICELIELPEKLDAATFFDPTRLPFNTTISHPVVAFPLSPRKGVSDAENVILLHLQTLAKRTELDIAAAEAANLGRIAKQMDPTMVYTHILETERVTDENRELVKEAAEFIEQNYRVNEPERKVLDDFLDSDRI